jgi:hypothetical protein
VIGGCAPNFSDGAPSKTALLAMNRKGRGLFPEQGSFDAGVVAEDHSPKSARVAGVAQANAKLVGGKQWREVKFKTLNGPIAIPRGVAEINVMVEITHRDLAQRFGPREDVLGEFDGCGRRLESASTIFESVGTPAGGPFVGLAVEAEGARGKAGGKYGSHASRV